MVTGGISRAGSECGRGLQRAIATKTLTMWMRVVVPQNAAAAQIANVILAQVARSDDVAMTIALTKS